MEQKKIPTWFWIGIIGVILLKLWLIEGQALYAIGFAVYDDQLFLRLAWSLLHGQWLGPYDQLTLIKGPFYSMWIALSFILGVPLLKSEQLLYLFACFLFMWSVRPLIKRYVLLLLFFIFLSFNPASYSLFIMTRVIREGIYPSLTMIITACAIGLLLQQGSSRKWSIIWAVGFGTSLGAFWLTREEGIWILPMLAILYLLGFLKTWQMKSKEGIREHLFMWGLPLLIWGLMVGIVSGLNYLSYGVFIKTEMDEVSFQAAYGALLRVKPPEWMRFVDVTKATRQQIYAVSPAFAELKGTLEGSLGQEFAGNGKQDGLWKDEIKSGWFIWAFRAAVSSAGYYNHGKYPVDYYTRLANEINTACDQDKLDCYSARATLTPVWRNEYLLPLVQDVVQFVPFTVSFQQTTPFPYPSIGNDQDLNLFRDLTNERLSAESITSQKQVRIDGWAFKTGLTLSYLVKRPDGTLAENELTRLTSDDVYNYFLNQGMEIPEAKQARFSIVTTCSSGCVLDIMAAGKLLTQLPIDSNLTGYGAYIDGMNIVIDKSTVSNTASLSGQTRSDNVKLGFLEWINDLYRKVTPYLVLIAVITYIILLFKAIKRREFFGLGAICTVLLVGYFARLIVIAMVDVTSFPAAFSNYLSPVYILLLAFIIFSLIGGLSDIKVSYRFLGGELFHKK